VSLGRGSFKIYHGVSQVAMNKDLNVRARV